MRAELKKGEKAELEIKVPDEAFFYYNRNMVYDMHNGDYEVLLGTSGTDILQAFEVRVRDKKIIL